MTHAAENGRARLLTAHQRDLAAKVEQSLKTLEWNETSSKDLVLEQLARELEGFWVPVPLPDQIGAIKEALVYLASGDDDGDNKDVWRRGDQLIFYINDEEMTVRTGRQLKIAFALWQQNAGQMLWLGFKREPSDFYRFYHEPCADAFQAVMADLGWIRWRIPEAEAEAAQEALERPEPGETTLTELAAEIGWPGSAQSLRAALPQVAAQFGWMAQPVYNPATGKVKRDSQTRRPLYRVSIFRSFV